MEHMKEYGGFNYLLEDAQTLTDFNYPKLLFDALVISLITVVPILAAIILIDYIVHKLDGVKLNLPMVSTKSITIQQLQIDKTLTIQQKIIYSSTVLLCLFILSYAYSYEIDRRIRLSETWIVWLVFVLLQAFLQNKIWANRLTIRIKYPTIRKV